MAEQEALTPHEIAEKITEAINAVLAAGDWSNSIFLKTAAVKLRELLVKTDQLLHLGMKTEGATDGSDKIVQHRTIPAGYCQVFILLYQAQNTDLQGWYHTIRTLIDYSATRPVYKEEACAREFIRSKTSGIECNGYAVVNIKNDSFYNVEQPPVDVYGHLLFILKENSVQLENIVEFVLANKKHYVIHDDALVLLKEE